MVIYLALQSTPTHENEVVMEWQGILRVQENRNVLILNKQQGSVTSKSSFHIWDSNITNILNSTLICFRKQKN